jgi:hypothetical protein
MSDSNSDKVLAELEKIRKADGGLLKPESVVAFAENPKTALHSRFEWDNDEAAHQHRLWQARHLIRVFVTVLPGTDTPTETFVSLAPDRNPDGGYRAIAEVMRDGDLRGKLLAQAMAEAESWAERYRHLDELAGVFAAIERVKRPASRSTKSQVAMATV